MSFDASEWLFDFDQDETKEWMLQSSLKQMKGRLESIDMSVFYEPPIIPDSLVALIDDPHAWEYLGEGTYNRVFRSQKMHALGEHNHMLVKKESFSSDVIFLHRTTEQQWTFSHAGKIYGCHLSPQELTLFLYETYNQAPDVVLPAREPIAYFLVLGSEGFYCVDLTFREKPCVVSTDDSELTRIKQILADDPHDARSDSYKLTTKTLMNLQKTCTQLHFECEIAPVIYNQKDRAVKLLKTFYPDLPVFNSGDTTLVMPYFGQDPSTKEIIDEMIRLFTEHQRIVTDAVIRDNFKKDDHKTYLIDTDIVVRMDHNTNRLSRASYELWDGMIKEQPDEGQCLNSYQKFLKSYERRSPAENEIYNALCALYYLHDQILDLSLCPPITPQLLKWVSFFEQGQFSLTVADLYMIQRDEVRELDVPKYFEMLECFIEKNQQDIFEDFLCYLSRHKSMFYDILHECCPGTLLTLAVKKADVDIVTILLHYESDPRVHDVSQEPYDALDWAIRNANWTIIEQLLNAIKKFEEVNVSSHRMWKQAEKMKCPSQKVVAEMRELNQILRFQEYLKDIYELFSPQYPCVIQWIDALFAAERAFLLSHTCDSATRAKRFIQTCEQLIINRDFGAIAKKEHIILIDQTIGKLESALFSLRESTSHCCLS